MEDKKKLLFEDLETQTGKRREELQEDENQTPKQPKEPPKHEEQKRQLLNE